MKKRLLCFLLIAAMLLTTGAFAAGSGTGSAVYENPTDLADGLTYLNQISYSSAGRRVETYTLENAPGGTVYPIVLAADTIYGGFDVNQMISYARGLGYNVVGAVNADFGYWDTRIPTGMVVENGIYKSSPEGNNAVAFMDGSAFVSFMPEVKITLTNDRTGASVSTTHLNKSRANGGLYLYSEYFSTVSTRTTADGWAVRFKVAEGDLSLSGTLQLEVTEVYEGKDAMKIGEDNLILTATAASELGLDFEKFAVGDTVTLTTECTDEKLAQAPWVSGGGNILVSEGAVYHPEWWDSSINEANPRTAVGIKADGTVVYHVMDGRTSYSKGSTLRELADDMISMGCEYAINLDGGGSSVMSLLLPGETDTKVVNSPSDGKLRSVCSYILFVTDETSDGTARHLFLKQNGQFVLNGATIPLTPMATDKSMKTVTAPANVSIQSNLGTVSGGSYTAGASTGVDRLTLSAGSASGSAYLHIIDKADSLTITNAETDKTVSKTTLEKGESLSLAVSAKYLLRDVRMDGVKPVYTVEGEIGTITEDGVFTADGKAGAEGKIIVSIAGLTAEVAVAVSFEFADMQSHWAADYVKELYEAGIVNGVTETTFQPDGSMKRGDFVLMLYRAAGSPEVTDSVTFTDVPADAYYAGAIAWAQAKGIAQGSGDGTFQPQDTLTRQQGFTFVYRALSELGVAAPGENTVTLDGFADADQVADWAKDAALALVSMGVVEGADGKLDPQAELTRAQMAKILSVTLSRK